MLIAAAPGENSIASLADFDPQPDFTGIRFAQEIYAGVNAYRNGKYVILTFPILTPAQYADVKTKLGISNSEAAECTVRLPDDDLTTFHNYNGVAVRPRDIRITYPCIFDVNIPVHTLIEI